MHKRILLLSILMPAAASGQAVQPGRWDVTSTMVDIAVPGVPGFLVRMMKGRSKVEHKCVAPDRAASGIAALLAPDPKAQCHVDAQQIGNGRYAQTLTCPQKRGGPVAISRSGTYTANGFIGRLHMNGSTPKGALSATIDQQAARTAGACAG